MGITPSKFFFRRWWWSPETAIEKLDHVEGEAAHWLDSYQKIILRAAWRQMGSKSATSSGGKTILKRLVLKDPGVRDVFGGFCAINGSVVAQPPAATLSTASTVGSERHKAKADAASFDKHGAYFAEFFKFLMEHLDQPDAIAARCEAIGREHRRAKPLGFKTDFWDHFGESVIETVREYHGWRRHRQAVAATNVLLSFVVDRMRAGFLQRQEISTWTKTPYPSVDTAGIIESKNEGLQVQQERRKSVVSKAISDGGYSNRLLTTTTTMEKSYNSKKEDGNESIYKGDNSSRATIARSQSEGPLHVRCRRLLPATPTTVASPEVVMGIDQGSNLFTSTLSSSRGRLAPTSSIRSKTRFATSFVTTPPSSETFFISSSMTVLKIESSKVMFSDV